MQNYKDLVLENEIGNMQIAQPIQDGVSVIKPMPLDVVNKKPFGEGIDWKKLLGEVKYGFPSQNPFPQNNQIEVLEENATFVLNSDFKYLSGYDSSSGDGEIKLMVMKPKFSILKAGTKVSGRVIRRRNNTMYRVKQGFSAPPPYNDFLVVNGFGANGFIEIPIEQLKRDIPNNTQNNNGAVVPVKNNNKNLLMIVGAFLVGYVVFRKGKSE
jgi:hypothetical protein